MAYLVARMLYVGFAREHVLWNPSSFVRSRWFAPALLLLVAARFGYALASGYPQTAAGQASVIGAHRILHGSGVYGMPYGAITHGDTYGPIVYLAYVPFAAVFSGSSSTAAHAAAIVWDSLMLAALYLLGRRLRGGSEGKLLGLVLAYAWAAYPYSLFVKFWGWNDALTALLLICLLLVIGSPRLRGLACGLAAAAKLFPTLLAPMLAATRPQRRVRDATVFGFAFVAVVFSTFAPFIPAGGLQELYNRTIGFQAPIIRRGADAHHCSVLHVRRAGGRARAWPGADPGQEDRGARRRVRDRRDRRDRALAGLSTPLVCRLVRALRLRRAVRPQSPAG